MDSPNVPWWASNFSNLRLITCIRIADSFGDLLNGIQCSTIFPFSSKPKKIHGHILIISRPCLYGYCLASKSSSAITRTNSIDLVLDILLPFGQSYSSLWNPAVHGSAWIMLNVILFPQSALPFPLDCLRRPCVEGYKWFFYYEFELHSICFFQVWWNSGFCSSNLISHGGFPTHSKTFSFGKAIIDAGISCSHRFKPVVIKLQ